MKIDQEKKKYKKIKQRFPLFPKTCCQCLEEYVFEPMWKIERDFLLDYTYYCKHCFPTKDGLFKKKYLTL